MPAIRRTLRSFGLIGALLFPHSPTSKAQTTVSDQAITQELCALAKGASLIFVGQIVAIERVSDFVDVTFQVEQQISGPAGSSYTMREWAALWPAGYARYAVGQRVLAFVHAASAAGASSPVHGAEGLVPVVVQGANAPELVDIRRVAASVHRAKDTSLPDLAQGGMLLSEVLASLPHGAAEGLRSARYVSAPLRARLPGALQPTARLSSPVSTQSSAQSFHPSATGAHLRVGR